MKAKTLLTSSAVLMAAWMTSGAAFAQAPDKGIPHSGAVETDKSGAAGTGARSGGAVSNVRSVQQALKDKGFDPGPVDGVMGERTRDALRSFQTASNLQPTGNLSGETAEKLGVQASGSQRSNRSSAGPVPGDAVKESDDNRKSKSGNLNEENAAKSSGSPSSTKPSSGSMPRDAVKERDDDRKSK